jgi:surface antigen
VQAGDEHIPTLPTGNGGEWWGEVSGYETGQTPQLGAVMCWAQDGGLGHVAIVEEIIREGTDIVGVRTSNSGYPDNFFWVDTAYSSDQWLETSWMGSDWHFQGFIYNPYACQRVTPEPPEEDGEQMSFLFYVGRIL